MTIQSHSPEISVEQLMQKIREEVARSPVATHQRLTSHRETGELTIEAEADVSGIANQIGYIVGFINTAESRSQVRNQLPDKYERFPFVLLKPFQFLALKILNTLFRDQREVNYNILIALRQSLELNQQLLSLVKDLRSQADSDLHHLHNILQDLSGYVRGIEHNLGATNVNVENAVRNSDSAKARLDNVEHNLGATNVNVESAKARLDNVEHNLGATNVNVENVAQDVQNVAQNLGQNIEAIDADIKNVWRDLGTTNTFFQGMEARLDIYRRDTVNQVQSLENRVKEKDEYNFRESNFLKSDLIQQKRLITLFLEEAGKRLPENFNQEQVQKFSSELDHVLDAFYVAFEDRFRGSRESIHKRLEVYLPLLKNAQIAPSDSLIVDLGCGRGEWLELLKENRYKAVGVDLNTIVISECQGKGLDVTQGDIIEYLKAIPDDSVAVVTGFHIIEHLPFEILVKLLNETLRVLRRGGLAIFETPNPANVLVGSCNFYFDPTHRNPLPSLTTQFLVQYCGFSQVEILNLNPSDGLKVGENSDNSELSELSKQFNQYFYGPMDYTVIGYKLID